MAWENCDVDHTSSTSSLCCAALEGHELPPAMSPNEWAVAEVLERGEIRPPGFNEDAAAYSCSVQGFYVFHWNERRRTMPETHR
ncbi:MAG TPA: hypothetical protein VHL98_04280 [Microvirga sp.]|nr:hypothetical protein [Microvirga sp.]